MTLLDIQRDARELIISLGRSPDLGARIDQLNMDHLDEVEDFFLRLDRETRCRRFGHAAADHALRSHSAKAMADAAHVLGVYAGGDLRGVLEVYSCAPHSFAEVALVVEKDWRRRGLGWLLLCAAIRVADNLHVKTLRLVFTRDNWPMRRLTNKANARFDLVLDEICADIAPRAHPIPS